MNIVEIAKECNGDLTTFDNEPLCDTFAISNLEKFAAAVIDEYKASLVPVAYMRDRKSVV